MKAISSALLTHSQGDVSTLALCWKITRRDGVVLGFTTHIEDLVISGVTYAAATGSYSATTVRSTSDLAVDNLEIEAILDSAAITEADLLAGLYNYAAVELFEVNYLDLSMGKLTLRKGTIGEVSVDGPRFSAELRGMMQALQQTIGRVYAKRCDADLGDTRCSVALAGITISAAVTAVTDQSVFTASAVPARAGGKLTWTSGENAGLSMEVKTIAGSVVTLNLPMPFAIAITDTFDVYPGCDKNLSTCRGTFNNVVNFRGYPYIPGPDRALQYPDAR